MYKTDNFIFYVGCDAINFYSIFHRISVLFFSVTRTAKLCIYDKKFIIPIEINQ